MKKTISTLILSLPLLCMAQEGALRKAQRQIDNFAYAEAIQQYEVLLNHGSDSSVVAKGMADSYYALRDMEAAADWYALAESESIESESACQYALALYSTGASVDGPNECPGLEPMDADLREVLMKENTRFTTAQASFNTEGAEFGPVYFGEDLVFVSDRNEKTSVRKQHAWNNRPFLDLYILREDKYEKPFAHKIEAPVNTSLHEGPGCFNPDGDEFYFTRNQTGRKGLRKLEILQAKMVYGYWQEITPFAHNKPECSTGHPAISPDGRYLVFASDREGSNGGSDLWICSRLEDESWSEPVNAGARINTELDELFPSFDKDGFLYFASEGNGGLGGLDIFECLFENGEVSDPINLGTPVNSPADDFSIAFNPYGTEGYFASNRNGKSTDDNLYRLTVLRDRLWSYTGTVTDDVNGDGIPGTSVRLVSNDGQTIATSTTEADGIFTVVVMGKPTEVAQMEVQPGAEYGPTTILADELSFTRYTSDVGEIALTPLKLTGIAELKEASTGEPIEGISATLIQRESGKRSSTVSDDSGILQFDLEPESDYELVLAREGYFTQTAWFSSPKEKMGKVNLNEVAEGNFSMEKIEVNKTVRIENINYDYNDFRIREDAAYELDKVVKLLEDNPSMEIELGSHTDARGSDSYNLKLSKKRAKAAVDYIVNNGIETNRIQFKGYGETSPINTCGDPSECDESAHEENRRTEFKVIAF